MPKETFFNLAEEKREKIIRSAIHEFVEHGYEKGNIGDIAKAAGVSKGSMYQYFEDKKELFNYAVKWSLEMMTKKFNNYSAENDGLKNIFEFYLKNLKDIWIKMTEEREVVIFVEDVFLGKYNKVADEMIAYMMKMSEAQTLMYIQAGKREGYIRQDMDDKILSLFMTSVTMSIKSHIMNRAREKGADIVSEDFEVIRQELLAMLELLKNGMGAK